MTWQLSWKSSGVKEEPAEPRVGPSCAATVWNGALVGWMNGFVFGAVYGAVPLLSLLSAPVQYSQKQLKTRTSHWGCSWLTSLAGWPSLRKMVGVQELLPRRSSFYGMLCGYASQQAIAGASAI